MAGNDDDVRVPLVIILEGGTGMDLPYNKFSIVEGRFQGTGRHANTATEVNDARSGLVHQRPKLMRNLGICNVRQWCLMRYKTTIIKF